MNKVELPEESPKPQANMPESDEDEPVTQSGSTGVNHESSEEQEESIQQDGASHQQPINTPLEKSLGEAIAGQGLSWSRKKTLTNIDIAREVVRELLGEMPLKAINYVHQKQILEKQREITASDQEIQKGHDKIEGHERDIEKLNLEIDIVQTSIESEEQLASDALAMVPICVEYAKKSAGEKEYTVQYIQLKYITYWTFLNGATQTELKQSDALPFPTSIENKIFEEWSETETPLKDFFLFARVDNWTQNNLVTELLKEGVRKNLATVLLNQGYMADNFDQIFVVSESSEGLVKACQSIVESMILFNKRMRILEKKKNSVAELEESVLEKKKKIEENNREIHSIRKEIHDEKEAIRKERNDSIPLEIALHDIKRASEDWIFSWQLGSSFLNLMMDVIHMHYTYTAGDPAPNPVKKEVLTNMTIDSEVDLEELEFEIEKAKKSMK